MEPLLSRWSTWFVIASALVIAGWFIVLARSLPEKGTEVINCIN